MPNITHPLYRTKIERYKCCILIPTYNNSGTLAALIDEVLTYTHQIVIVNDGSTDSTAEILSQYPQLIVIHQPQNKGKGLALRTGFEAARQAGYDYAISIDSDGQHRPSDIPVFIDKLAEAPKAIIVGARNMNQENVPGSSNFGHNFSNFWFRFETGIDLPDTQSGYRLYPLRALEGMRFYTTKYEFEIEVMVRAAWKGIDVLAVPIDVYYPPAEERITHFRKIPDFTRISILNTVLVTIALLWVKPLRFFSDLKKKVLKTS